MTSFGTGPDGLAADPQAAAVEALADLAALLRGGGQVGVDPQQLAAQFADAVLRLAADGPLVLSLRDDGLFVGDDAFWSGDLLARRVASALDTHGFKAVTIRAEAPRKTVQGVAVVLARDWSSESANALQDTIRKSATPGVHFDFSSSVPEAIGGGHEPGALLGFMRAAEGQHHAVIVQGLDRIRQRMAQPADVVGAILGAGLGLRQRLEPELTAVEEGRDISSERLGRIAHAVMYRDPAGLQAADSFRLVVDHFESLVGLGRTADAFDLIRRSLSLIDESVTGRWPHKHLIEAEVGALFEPQAVKRLVSSANSHLSDPAAGDSGAESDASWRQLLFVLGGALPLDRVVGVASLFGELQRPSHRQAVADGLVISLGQDLEVWDKLLHRVEGAGQSIILLAIGRLDAPTLLEKILARMDSPLAVVRQDALVAMRKHRSPRSQQVVRKALLDADAAVRVEALRYVSVYRDADSASVIMDRLRSLPQDVAQPEELRALGMAYALIARQEGVLPLTRLAQEAGDTRSDATKAAIIGLASLGASGRSALNGLARTSPELRRLVHGAGVTE